MEKNINEIEINGVKYVKKGSEEVLATSTDGLEYVIIRADRAGVFAGYLVSRDGTEVVLRDVRRLWYWSGAASLSELANKGVKNASACKFPAPNKKIIVTGVIEVIPATETARKIIEGVPVWSA
jgi:hypothetical protein